MHDAHEVSYDWCRERRMSSAVTRTLGMGDDTGRLQQRQVHLCNDGLLLLPLRRGNPVVSLLGTLLRDWSRLTTVVLLRRRGY